MSTAWWVRFRSRACHRERELGQPRPVPRPVAIAERSLDNNRLLISIVVVLGILFLYQELLQWRYPDRYGPKSRQAQKGPFGVASEEPNATPAPMTPGNTLAERSAKPGEISAAPAPTIKVDTSFYEALLTGYGGRLESFRLKKFKQTSQSSSPPYQIIRPTERLPIGLLISSGGETTDDGDVVYATEAPSAIEATAGHPASVTFTGKTSNGFSIQKTFTFTDASYVFSIAAAVNARGIVKPDGIGLTMSQPLTALSGYRDYPTLQSDVNGKAVSIGEKQLLKGAAALSGIITYVGFGDRYFLSAFLPANPAHGTVAMDYVGSEADAKLLFADVDAVTTQVFMGPKELDVWSQSTLH